MTDASIAAYATLAGTLALPLYSYLGYPVLLRLLGSRRPAAPTRPTRPASDLPVVSIVIPVYNEAAVIAETLEAILRLDYPAHRRQIVVVSDASTDGTDDVVARFATRGVELLRQPHRAGKTAAENAARSRLRGDVVVNTDASVRIHPAALKALVAALADPTVGVASGRDVSVDRMDGAANRGERTYVGYEMWVRDLETRLRGAGGAGGDGGDDGRREGAGGSGSSSGSAIDRALLLRCLFGCAGSISPPNGGPARATGTDANALLAR